MRVELYPRPTDRYHYQQIAARGQHPLQFGEGSPVPFGIERFTIPPQSDVLNRVHAGKTHQRPIAKRQLAQIRRRTLEVVQVDLGGTIIVKSNRNECRYDRRKVGERADVHVAGGARASNHSGRPGGMVDIVRVERQMAKVLPQTHPSIAPPNRQFPTQATTVPRETAKLPLKSQAFDDPFPRSHAGLPPLSPPLPPIAEPPQVR